MVFVADLDLELSHSPLHFEQLHVEGGLFTPKCSNLLLNARVLGLLESVVTFHFLLDLEVLVCQSLAHFLCLELKHTLQRFFF